MLKNIHLLTTLVLSIFFFFTRLSSTTHRLLLDTPNREKFLMAGYSYFLPVHSGRATKANSQYSNMCDITTLSTVRVMSWGEILQSQIDEWRF